MASVMLCDGGHDESVVGEVLTQWISTGEANVWCPACYEVFLWAAVEALPTFDTRVKAYMDALMEAESNKKSNTARKRRKAGLPEQEPKDSEPGPGDAESTATDE
ncbi:MAG TPA: hypothetical protein VHT26_07600 [Trebonia sp.]|jgi:hypothetical protein|nr:hypothetical protein [Trebonia sp.]